MGEVLARTKASFTIDGKDVTPAQMLERLGFSRAHLSSRVGDLSGGQFIGRVMARRFGFTTPIPPYPAIHIGCSGVMATLAKPAFQGFCSAPEAAAPATDSTTTASRGWSKGCSRGWP